MSLSLDFQGINQYLRLIHSSQKTVSSKLAAKRPQTVRQRRNARNEDIVFILALRDIQTTYLGSAAGFPSDLRRLLMDYGGLRWISAMRHARFAYYLKFHSIPYCGSQNRNNFATRFQCMMMCVWYLSPPHQNTYLPVWCDVLCVFWTVLPLGNMNKWMRTYR